MPIYVFRCESCGNQFDHLQKLSDPDPEVCPNCGKQSTLHKQVTAPAFRLAGSGWYETDFKSAREKKHNLAGDSGAPKASSPDKGSSDDKTSSTTTPPPASKPSQQPAAPAD